MVGKTIEVTISPDGEITIEAQGYAGASCEKETKKLEDALGVVGKRTLKPERWDSEQGLEAKRSW